MAKLDTVLEDETACDQCGLIMDEDEVCYCVHCDRSGLGECCLEPEDHECEARFVWR